MLDSLRRHSKGWIATFFMGLLILSFGVWGVGDIFRGRSDNSVARVGSQKISQAQLQEAFQRQLATLRQRIGPEFDAEKAKSIGLDQRVLTELISIAAFDQGAQDLGVGMPDAVVAREIHNLPAFKGPTGAFDRTRFEALLRENNFTEDRFVKALRSDLIRKQIFDALLGGLPVPDAMAAPLIRFQGERRVARYVVVPPEKAAAAAPVADDEVKTRYEADKARYMSPEYRRFTYVDLDPAQLAKSLPVKDEDIKAYFEQHKAQYMTPEKRALAQIVYASEASAREAADAAKAGKSFADLAAVRKLTAADADLGEKTKAQLDAKLADPVFAAKPGEIVGPIEGRFGWLLVHVTKVTPAIEKSLDELKPQIAADLAKESAREKIYKLASEFEDARGGGAPIEAAAKAVGFEAVTIPAVDAQGKDPNGTPVEALKGKETLLAEAFKGQAGDDRDLQQVPDGGYRVLRVDSVTPPAERPLTAVAAELRASIEAERRHEALAKTVDELAAKGKAGTSLDALAAGLGRAVLKSAPLDRGSTNDTFSIQAIQALFAAKPGEFAAAPVGTGDGYVLLQLDQTITPSDDEIRGAFAQLKPRLGEILGEEIAEIYGVSLQTRYGVKVDERGVKTALGDS